MVSGTSSVGVEFYRSTASITGSFSAWGTCLALSLPKSSNKALEMTPINSTTEQFIKERVERIEPFDATFVMDATLLETAKDDLDATTPRFYQVQYPAGVSKTHWTFEAHLTDIAPPKIAENSPTKMVVVLTFQPQNGLVGLT